jgi:hypothetical protein
VLDTVPTVGLPPAAPSTDQVTPAGPSLTVAVSWALAPTCSVGGAPEIATVVPVGCAPTVSETDATDEARG